MIPQLNFTNDLDVIIDSMTNSPAKELCLNSKFMYRHHKHNATKLKKSKSAYMFFSMEVRANLKREGNHLGPNEIMKEISSLWKCLPKREKVKFETQAKEDKERYRLEKEELLRTNPSEVAKNRTKNNHIKKPWSAYDFFMNENYPLAKAQNPDLYSADILKIVSKKWKALDQSQKVSYQKKAEIDKKEKRAQLKAFELKKVLENCQESPMSRSDEGSKSSSSRKRVKTENYTFEASDSTASQTCDIEDPSEQLITSEPEDSLEMPIIPSFPCRMDSLLEQCLNFSNLPNLIRQASQQRPEKQVIQEPRQDYSFSLQKQQSIDFSMFAPLRLEDFRFGSFIEPFEKHNQASESRIVNMFDDECQRNAIDCSFDVGMSKQPSLYMGHVERFSGEPADFHPHGQVLNETILNTLY